MNPATEYAKKVLSGKIIAGRYIKLACERYLHDLNRKDIYLDETIAAKWVSLFEDILVHVEGHWAGTHIKQALWQKFMLYNIFGWHYTNGRRRFKEVYVQIARKNAKTTELAGVGVGCLLLGKENTTQIVIGSNNEEQAQICATMTGRMIQTSPDLKEMEGKNAPIQVYTYKENVTKITYLEQFDDYLKRGFLLPFNKKAITKDGYSPEIGIIDEYHGAEDDAIKNVIESGQGGRLDPLTIVITTAGKNKNGPCYRNERAVSTKILDGVIEDDRRFALVYELDKDDDWQDEKNWVKANPLMYHEKLNPDPHCSDTIYEFLKSRYKAAKNEGGSKLNDFKTKNLNMWVDADTTWIESEVWKLNTHGITEEELKGVECYGGVDLARTRDLNAYALVFPNVRENIHALKVWFWIPKPKLEVTDGGVDYRRWVELGYIRVIDTDAIDPADVGHDIVEISKDYNVQSIAFDPKYANMGASQVVIQAGYEATEYSQGIMNMSPPTKEFEFLATNKQLEHFNNPVLAWNLANVVLYEDKNENIAPHKGKSANRIDGAVASIIAIGEWMTLRNQEEKGPMIYSYDD